MSSEYLNNADHDELMLKLPWLLNGTLNESEASSLREHVAHCDHCRNEMESLAMMNAAINDATHNTVDSQASFNAMRKRIAEQPSNPLKQGISRIAAAFGFLIQGNPAPRWAMASVAAVLLSVVWLQQTQLTTSKTVDNYRVLSSDIAASSVSLNIGFDKDVTDAESEAILANITAKIEQDLRWEKSSPNTYQISVIEAISESTIDPAMLKKIIDTLNDIPGVASAGIAQ